MSERKNVQTEHKWVGQAGWDEQFHWSAGGWKVRVRKPKTATLYDSRSDVPDDCTPVRVRVDTWTEEGEPEPWDYRDWKDTSPGWFRIYELDDGWEIVEPSPTYPDPVRHHKAREILESEWARMRKGSVTAIPVRIETKREVTLDPEPTETGCRCREVVEKGLLLSEAALTPFVRIPNGVQSIVEWRNAARQALADCDCKSEADDE